MVILPVVDFCDSLVRSEGLEKLMQYEPIELNEDSRKLVNKLIEVGIVAGNLVSRAAVEHGDHHSITEMFDNVAQRITATLLEFQIAVVEEKNLVEALERSIPKE